MTSHAVFADVGAGFHWPAFISPGVTHEVCSYILLRATILSPRINMAANMTATMIAAPRESSEQMECLVSV